MSFAVYTISSSSSSDLSSLIKVFSSSVDFSPSSSSISFAFVVLLLLSYFLVLPLVSIDEAKVLLPSVSTVSLSLLRDQRFLKFTLRPEPRFLSGFLMKNTVLILFCKFDFSLVTLSNCLCIKAQGLDYWPQSLSKKDD